MKKKKIVTHKDISKRIRAQRLKARFTRDQVAALLAIPLKDYIEMEDGSRKLSENFCEDFSNLYNLPLDFFISEDTEKNILDDF